MASRRVILALGTLSLLGMIGAWQGLRYWWYRGYSSGTRSGVIRKVSVKGPPVCKYLSGELVLVGVPGQQSQVWEFSVDDADDRNPLVGELRRAEKSGKQVTLRYRQDLHMWWRCTSLEHFVTGIE